MQDLRNVSRVYNFPAIFSINSFHLTGLDNEIINAAVNSYNKYQIFCVLLFVVKTIETLVMNLDPSFGYLTYNRDILIYF